MQILVLGVGEAADPNFPNASVSVAASGFRLLIDCGHSVPPLLWRALPDPEAIDALCLTHHHPDHCFGLVPALIRWADDGRRKPLPVVTSRDGWAQIAQMLAAGGLDRPGSLPFALDWQDVERTTALGPFALATAPTLHALPNRAYSLAAGGRRFCYSGDGRPTDAAEALYGGADLLFQECYTLEGGPSFHCDWPTAAALAARTGVPAARLYHVRTDQRAGLAAACRNAPRIALAEPGERYEL